MPKINPNSSSPHPTRVERTPDYPRNLHHVQLEIPGATHGTLKGMSTYQNALQNPSSLRDRVSRKLPAHKRVGAVGLAAAQSVFSNKGHLTRMAPSLHGTAPLSPPHKRK